MPLRVAPSFFKQALSAVVCDEQNGMALSVVSALSRAGVDPLREAARLTRLRHAEAVESLAQTLSRAPDALTSRDEVNSTALRLVQLLPDQRMTTESGASRSGGLLWRTASVVAAILAAALYFWS